MHKLAYCYSEGECGFPEDRGLRFKWLKAECENEENPNAWYILATTYEEGDGTPKDDERAFFWYKKSADAGCPGSCLRMPELYARGAGTPPDMEQARAYLTRLRELEEFDDEFLKNYETLLPEYEKEGIAVRAAANPDDMELQNNYALGCLLTDPDKAVKIFEGLGEKGHQPSLIYLHMIFSKGVPDDGSLIPADQDRANYWLEKAASLEGEWAYKQLVSNYQSGKNGYPKDNEKAFYWMDRMLQQDPNDPGAQVLAGVSYLDGDGVARDMERGIELVRKSAQAGLDYGQYIYGRLYHFGGGSIKKDLKQAEHWMQEAVKNGWTDAEKELEAIRQEMAAQGGGGSQTNIFCSYCGAELQQGTDYCTKCGKMVGGGKNEKQRSQDDVALPFPKRNGLIMLLIGIIAPSIMYSTPFLRVVGWALTVTLIILVLKSKKRYDKHSKLLTAASVLSVIDVIIAAISIMVSFM